MEAVGFWPRGSEPCGRRRSGSGTPNAEHSSSLFAQSREIFRYRVVTDTLQPRLRLFSGLLCFVMQVS